VVLKENGFLVNRLIGVDVAGGWDNDYGSEKENVLILNTVSVTKKPLELLLFWINGYS
jgi:hypothetical protein